MSSQVRPPSHQHDLRDQLTGTGHSVSSPSLGTPLDRPEKRYSVDPTRPSYTIRDQWQEGVFGLTLSSLLTPGRFYYRTYDKGLRGRDPSRLDDGRVLGSNDYRPQGPVLRDGSVFIVPTSVCSFCQTEEKVFRRNDTTSWCNQRLVTRGRVRTPVVLIPDTSSF